MTSAAAANALPVAEYTLAAILFAGKRVLRTRHRYRALRTHHDWRRTRRRGQLRPYGRDRRRVRIGRRVIELLRPFDLRVLLYDPYVDVGRGRRLGVETVPLDELCARQRRRHRPCPADSRPPAI